MDSLCQYINRIINIDDEREKYTKMYDTVRIAFINGLKEESNFKLLFSDLRLCGSYADNLKVSKPDEFDLIMGLQFPHNEKVEISPDNINRSNVFINISKVLLCLEEEKKDDARKFLGCMVNSEKYFLEDKFQNWLQGCFARLMTKFNRQLKHTDGSILRLAYSRQGPAHTIVAINGPHQFAIDFVPGFLFEASKKICKRKVTTEYWQAIPKPMAFKENKSFRTSYTDSERRLFGNKNNFKAILRMMKKFRDNKPKMVNLKSYYLKTLFLWHDENNCDPGFWNKSSRALVHEMFGVLESALSAQMIPFFWDKNLNLLGNLSKAQITSMYHEVVAARKILMQPRGKFTSIFLTEEEQRDFTEYQESGVDVDKLCQKISSVINIDTQKDTTVRLQMEFVKNKFIRQLKENENFSLLFYNTNLFGSYADNLNVSKVKRLKIVICFLLPHNDDVVISRDNVKTGNVFINISRVLDRLAKDKKDDAWKFLQKMVNLKMYLLQDKFQSWFEGCFDTVLRKLNRQLTYSDGSILHLSFRKNGPAHTIQATNSTHKFTIDFIPGFLFEASKKMCKRAVTSKHWMAIPKPIEVRDNMSFMTSYDECVHKNQFKNALRLMKKFRDNKPKMVNLKGYHIKTLFLWHNERCASDFWSKPTIDILHVMFRNLGAALEKNEIPWFWDNKLNLLSGLNYHQIDSMYAEVRNAIRVMMHAASSKEFLAIFLNDQEISKVTAGVIADLPRRVPSVDQEAERRANVVNSQTVDTRDSGPSILTTALAIGALWLGFKYLMPRRDNT